MKKESRVVFVLVVFVFGVLWSGGFLGAQDELKDDDYGVVKGKIVDFETGEPVNEEFYVIVYKYHPDGVLDFFLTFQSDQNGNFSKEIKSGQYYIKISPGKKYSRYCFEMSPNIKIKKGGFKNLNSFFVEKGKVTKMIRYARHGGGVRLRIVDAKGHAINPAETFLYFGYNGVGGQVKSEEFLDEVHITSITSDGSIRYGMAAITSLIPGKYQFNITFGVIGYGNVDFELEIIKGQIIDKNIVLDMTNQTGIQGLITDEEGRPLKGVRIVGADAANISSEDGYYRMVHVKTGLQTFDVEYEIKDGVFFDKTVNVQIENNKIIEKNITIQTYGEK